MTETLVATPATGKTRPTTCDPATRVTKSLLGYGVIAGPLYVAVSLTEALARPGFDLRRHEWSLLANGRFGWIHILTMVVSGLMTVAFAVGVRRALGTGRGATWVPRLLAGFGAGLVAAGFFRADPAFGFPVGTPAGPGPVSWHGMLHLVCAGLGFLGLITACFVLARRYAVECRRGWARYSRATGVIFLAGFACVATGAGAIWANLVFTASAMLALAWVSAVAVDGYQHTTR
jgi:Protein of unknown function (DUF998)